MSKRSILWIISISFIVIGALIFVCTMSMLGWNFSMLEGAKFSTITKDIEGKFSNIKIYSQTSDVRILTSEDGEARAVLSETKKLKHDVSVQNGVLTVSVVDERSWIDRIGLNFNSPSVTLYLPKSAYGALLAEGSTGDIEIASGLEFTSIDVTVSTADVRCFASAKNINLNATTGDLFLSDVSAESISLSASTGDISASNLSVGGSLGASVSTGDATFTDTRCGSFSFRAGTGDLVMTRLVSEGLLTCITTTGDVRFEKSDAAEISITTSTGDVKGTLLSPKYFITHIDTGRGQVPETTEGGFCETTVSTGDVIISIAE